MLVRQRACMQRQLPQMCEVSHFCNILEQRHVAVAPTAHLGQDFLELRPELWSSSKSDLPPALETGPRGPTRETQGGC
eukprot:NODE_26478_length_549_cov_2.827014.p2 GENE.NODE_26478_length_549_cov_2.827014~~NODE_26478_length_549_cov_2.827014.p2  ORF type:complete len:78 (-),score=7.21 NODE_26478_length_549_cov_2.827014:214-447(-)